MARNRHRRCVSWLRGTLPLLLLPALALLVVSSTPASSHARSDPPRAAATASPATAFQAQAAGAPTVAPSAPSGPPGGADEGPASADTPRTLDEAPAPTPAWQLTGYRWPLPHARVTLPFGPTAWGTLVVNGQLFHDGLDMATFCGDRVVAAHSGVVLAAGRHFDDYMGWLGDLTPYYASLDSRHWWNDLPIVVVIDDGNGYWSMYAHFNDIAVKVGQKVAAGDYLGHEGMSGHATGCHLHYGLFSPLDQGIFQLDPAIAKRMQLPSAEIARIDPLLVLPYRPDVEEMRRWSDR